MFPDARTVIEIGGEDSKLIILEKDPATGTSRLVDFEMNSICAAGTGSFLDQQARRIGVPIEKEFGEMWPNVWTSVMDHNNMVFYLRQADYPNTVWVDLKKIDFNILDKLGILDPKSFDLTGDVTGKFEWKPVEEGDSN